MVSRATVAAFESRFWLVFVRALLPVRELPQGLEKIGAHTRTVSQASNPFNVIRATSQ
jgi:hypothetical protein